MTPAMRKKIEKRIYDTFSILDKTGANTKKYKDLFSNMNDSQFERYMKKFLYDDSENFYLEVETYVREPKMSDIEEAADFLGVPLYEHVALPFFPASTPDNIVTTPVPVAVGYIHMKRVQQMLAKKNSMSIHTSTRQGKTGQVIGEDKNARVSDMENINLVSMGLDKTMEEFLHCKADNLKAKTEMLNKINTDGFVSLKDISKNKTEKVALNTLDVFFTSAMIKTDLVTNGLALPRTLRNLNRDVSSISSKYNKDE